MRRKPKRAEAGSAQRQARTAALICLVVSLPACKHFEEPGQVAGWTMVDPAARHPIIVSQEPETVKFHLRRGADGLSPAQRAELLEFAARSRASDAGNSRLVISVPSGSENEVAAMDAVAMIRRVLSERGFAESSISVEGYHDDRDRNPPIRVSFLRFIAHAPECGTWPANLARQYDNLPYSNFGCATQRNLAAMVANPADLVGPRTETDRSSERRDVTWDKYVHGESTTSQKSEDEKVKAKSDN